MKSGVIAAAAAMVIGGAAGCSSGPPPVKPRPGTLPPGTAQVTIDGDDEASTGVHCATVDSLTTIKTGDGSSGATAMVSTAKKLTVKFVRIRNLHGFAVDYNLGLGGDAAVALTDTTYDITGTAFGYGPTSIEPTTAPFKIKATC